MDNAKRKKLSLNKETLCQLDDPALSQAVGGTIDFGLLHIGYEWMYNHLFNGEGNNDTGQMNNMEDCSSGQETVVTNGY